jgi:hypothetical protein
MNRIRSIVLVVSLVVLFAISGTAAAVTVSPSTAHVKPRAQLQFTASPSGVVVWNVTGAGCSGITCGSIDSSGLYVAPLTAPSPSTVTVAAFSLTDFSQGTATVTIGSTTTVAVSVSPSSVTLAVKGQQQFTASVTGSSNTAVTWAVSGIGCVGGSCGTISSAGLYTAPTTIPNPALATVTATSVADPTKSGSASVVIQSAASVSVRVSPSTAQVSTGAQQQFNATVTGTTNTSVKWSLSGCSGSACGTISTSGLYTAPSSLPSPPTVKVTATSVAAPAVSGSATVTVVSTPKLTISPASPSVKPLGQIQFSASGPQSGIVVWNVSGAGCSGISCGSINSSGLYIAPATTPSPNTVTVTAASLSNPTITGSTTVTIQGTSVSVGVSPSSTSVGVNAKQQFTANVTGSSNTAVTWSLSGSGCAGTTCGTISPSGLYTAPSLAPLPPFLTVTATSVADPTKSGSASVTITQQVGITISPTSAQVVEGQTKQFSATVSGTSNTAVNWSVSGTGCSGSGCGTITNSGLYTAPDSIPTQVIVTATSAADLSVSASATVTVIPPVIVTVSPTSAIVAVGTKEQFQVSVTGTTNKAVNWTVSGAGCTGSSCGTVSTAGLYTAPASLPSPATVIVKATSQAMSSASASATVSLVGSNNSKLTGPYAFSFTGYDANGSYLAAGSFIADGSGHLTSGQEDVNNFNGPSTAMSIAGTYTVSSDNRGTMIINGPLGTFTYKFALNSLGTKGRFISFDQSGVRGSGVIERQDPAAFDPSALANGYVLGLSGEDTAAGRVAALGLIFPDGSGFVSGSSLDVNDAGLVNPTYPTFSGIYSVDPTGRGTMTLLIPALGGGVLDFAFYVVSSNEFLLVSTDPILLNSFILSGPARIQNGSPFTAASFNGASIFTLTGTTGAAPQDVVGRLQFDGTNNTVVTFDENSGGKITVGGSMTGAYDLQLNGRGTLNLDTPTGSTIWFMYATGPNQGFLMDASTAAAGIGDIFADTIVPPFSNSDILGSYLFGPDDPVVQTTSLATGVGSFDGGSSVGGKGIVTGAQDTSQSSTLSPNQVLTGTYSVSPVSNNGRGALLLTSPTGGTFAVWVINTSQFVGLSLDSTTTQPVILQFQQ